MHGLRLIGVVAAVACAAGTTVAAGTPASGTVVAASVRTSVSAAHAPARLLPAHVFAPYYFNTSDTLAATSRASGARYLTLAFLQTPRPGSCTVDWNGDPAMPVGQAYASGIAAVQAAGGNVVPSFGGASADSADEELADSCHSVSAIAAQYEKVITTYHVTRLDLDTEEDSLNNYAGIDRRNQAIARVERWARATGRPVQFVYTLPTNTTGLDQGGSYVLQNAVADGARIAVVNAMTFDYYDNLPHEMADNTEGAAQQLFDRLHRLFPRDSQRQLWGMIGVTEDLGVDDFGPAETFTLADARTVERWATSRGLAELSFWNVQDDNSAGSQVKQAPYEFSHILEPFTGSAARPEAAGAMAPADIPRGSADPPAGNLRSVSCPSRSFCMAVDQFGDDALRWNGSAWTAAASIEPGGTRVELNAVSCADSSFCMAVDASGHALAWNGWSWSRPVPIDPHGAGLTAVSCPTASFCVTVDGHGNALTWTSGRWSRPVPIDSSGAGLQSVSCASASFCAAGDWNGNALTWNGTRWSAPAAVDPTTASSGGGLPSVSCPTARFCLAADWNGGEVHWNGVRWSKPVTFDPDGAGGNISVSCVSPSLCRALDGNNALTWNGHKWSAPVLVDLTGDGVESVSCASVTFCMAVDWNGNALSWNGASWSATAISCPDSSTNSAGDCATAGSFADPRAGVLDSVSCTVGPRGDDPPRTARRGASSARMTFCAAVDGNGNAITGAPGRDSTQGPAWSAPAPIDPIAGILTSVSCPSASFCAAVDVSGYALTWNGTSWSRPVWSAASPADPHGGALTSVSCTSAPFCVAVDGNGRALTWDGTGWSAPVAVDLAGGGLTAVSCPSASSCVAVDSDGRALAWDGTSWSAPVAVDPHGGGLTAVSCSSASSCMAVDNAGNALAWDGHAWSAPAAADPHGGGLTSVSCSSAWSCVAVDNAGNALAWDGRGWSSPVPVDPHGGGLTAVSCPSAWSCVAADFDGRVLALR
jgi:hypothetical protein